jgi:hypothetical protein
MVDRSRFAVGRHVAYVAAPDDEPAVVGELWSAQIIAANRDGLTLLVRRPNGEPLVRQGVAVDQLSTRFGAAHEAPASTAYPYDETLHFNERRQVASVTLAGVPGTIDAAAASWWGTINCYKDMAVSFAHIHQVVDGGSGSTTAEVYRRRPGTSGAFTQILGVTLAAGGGDFGTGFALPLGAEEAKIERGDYLYMQLTDAMTGPAPLGLLIDVHMANR